MRYWSLKNPIRLIDSTVGYNWKTIRIQNPGLAMLSFKIIFKAFRWQNIWKNLAKLFLDCFFFFQNRNKNESYLMSWLCQFWRKIMQKIRKIVMCSFWEKLLTNERKDSTRFVGLRFSATCSKATACDFSGGLS